jgi:uncharacterized protein (TIGR03067 family)
MNLALALIPSMALLLGADDAKQDLKQLQGEWIVVAAERDGNKLPEESAKNMQLVIKDDTIEISEDKTAENPRVEIATLVLDPSKKPKQLDVKPTPKDAKPAYGIYELNGDNLKLCWAREGQERPTAFGTKPDSRFILLVLKRAKKG